MERFWENCRKRCSCCPCLKNNDSDSDVTEYSRGVERAGEGENLEMDEVEVGTICRGREVIEGFQTIHI